MRFKTSGVVVTGVIAVLWATSGTQRERAVLTGATPELVREREARVAARPDDPEATRALAEAYLTAQQSGLALALLEAAPPALRADARTRHIYARALLDQGRNDDALAVETEVVASCSPVAEVGPVNGRTTRAEAPAPAVVPDGPRSSGGEGAIGSGCDALVLAAAVRRAAILKELVALGVEDTRAHPDVSFVAYQNATREAHATLR